MKRDRQRDLQKKPIQATYEILRVSMNETLTYATDSETMKETLTCDRGPIKRKLQTRQMKHSTLWKSVLLSQRTYEMNLHTLTYEWDSDLCNRLWNYERDSDLWQWTYKKERIQATTETLWPLNDTLTYERDSDLWQRTYELNLYKQNTLTSQWDSNLCNRLKNYERDSELWQRTYDRGPIKGTYTRDPWNILTEDLWQRTYDRGPMTEDLEKELMQATHETLWPI